jgi:hypothetical protein
MTNGQRLFVREVITDIRLYVAGGGSTATVISHARGFLDTIADNRHH